MGGHVFLDDMSYESMSYGRSYFIGYILCEDMSCRSACLQDGITYRMMCFTGGHVLYEDRFYLRMSFRRACLTGRHVLQEYMFYRIAYLTGECVLQEDESYWRVCLTGGHVLHKGMSLYYERTCNTERHDLK